MEEKKWSEEIKELIELSLGKKVKLFSKEPKIYLFFVETIKLNGKYIKEIELGVYIRAYMTYDYKIKTPYVSFTFFLAPKKEGKILFNGIVRHSTTDVNLRFKGRVIRYLQNGYSYIKELAKRKNTVIFTEREILLDRLSKIVGGDISDCIFEAFDFPKITEFEHLNTDMNYEEAKLDYLAEVLENEKIIEGIKEAVKLSNKYRIFMGI